MKVKGLTVVVAVSATLMLAGCSSSGKPTDFATPSAPASAGTAAAATNPFLGIDPLGKNSPGVQVSASDPQAPFGVDTSNVTIPDDVTKVWNETAQSAPEDALKFLEISSAIIPRWENSASSSDDYRAVQPLMTPEAWSRLQDAADNGDRDSLASSLVPGRFAKDTLTSDGISQKIPAQTPLVAVPQNVIVSLAQGKEQFGDTNARLAVTADVYSQFRLEDGKTFYLKRNLTLYLVSLQSGWTVDNWKLNSTERA